MRRLRGMIQSGILGFDLPPNQLRAFVDLTMPINDAITHTESEGKYNWPTEARVSEEQIALKIANSPKAYTHPDRRLDDTHSLLQLGDGDPHDVCSGLISVPYRNGALQRRCATETVRYREGALLGRCATETVPYRDRSLQRSCPTETVLY